MYITQVYKTLHDWWRYIIGVGIAIIGVGIFSVPHAFAIFFGIFKGTVDQSRLEDLNYVMTLFEPNLNLVFILLPFAGGLLFLLLTVKFLHKQSIRMLTTARKKIDWKRFWFAFIFWGIVSSSMVMADYFFNPDGYINNFNLQPFLILCVIAILLVPLQTSFEEYFFRGYLMQGIGISSLNKYFPFIFIYLILSTLGYIVLTQLYSLGFLLNLVYVSLCIGMLLVLLKQNFIKKLTNNNLYNKLYFLLKRNSTPLIITSTAFGLLHIANPEVEKLGYIILIYYIGTGFFLGITTLMDDGIELALGFHAANNFFVALLVTADWTAFQTHSIFKDISDPTEIGVGETILPVFIIFPIMLLIFSKKYGWTNWKDKLFGAVIKPVVVEVIDEDVEVLE
ncbi:CPBP family intramembrane metalloprotease [Olleya sp. AH-315-K02]|nr:CPBP family intramembrane metalloprotease [Olleya sp. AH-315-K02]